MRDMRRMGVMGALIVMMALLWMPLAASATNHFVRQAGYGDSTGTSYANSMSRRQFNLKTTFAAGDTVWLCDTFTATSSETSMFQVQSSGANGNNIIISGNYPGHPGVIDGNNLAKRGFYSLYSSIKFYTLEYLEIKNIYGSKSAGGGWGITLSAGTYDYGDSVLTNWNINHCYIHDIPYADGGAIFMFGSGLKIMNNVIDNMGHEGIFVAGLTMEVAYNTVTRVSQTYDPYNSSYPFGHGDCFKKTGGSGDANTVRSKLVWVHDNVFDHRNANGTVNTAKSCILVGNSEGTIVEDNICYGGGMSLDSDSEINPIWRRNIVYNGAVPLLIQNTTGGTFAYNVFLGNAGVDLLEVSSSNVAGIIMTSGCTGTFNIDNNTFYDMAKDGIHSSSFSAFTLNIKNNIFHTIAGKAIYSEGDALTLGANYNSYYNITGDSGHLFQIRGTTYHSVLEWQNSTRHPDLNCVVGDPKVYPDMSLQSDSPLINAGTSLGYTEDVVKNAITDVPDIGAYEYTDAAPEVPTIETQTPINVLSKTMTLIAKISAMQGVLLADSVGITIKTGSHPALTDFSARAASDSFWIREASVALNDTASFNIIGRVPGTQYYYRFYFHNAAGWGYSAVDSVTTVTPSSTFFVSAIGSDSNTGDTEQTAWLTVGKANSATELVSGCTVLFRRGDTFTDAALACKTGLSYGAYGTGAAPIIQPSSGTSASTIATGINTVTLRDLTIQSAVASSRGLYISGTVSAVTIKNCSIGGTQYGIYSTATLNGLTVDTLTVAGTPTVYGFYQTTGAGTNYFFRNITSTYGGLYLASVNGVSVLESNIRGMATTRHGVYALGCTGYITIDNVRITGLTSVSSTAGIYLKDCTASIVQISNCYVQNTSSVAYYIQNTKYAQITNCVSDSTKSGAQAVYLRSQCDSTYINGMTIRNCGGTALYQYSSDHVTVKNLFSYISASGVDIDSVSAFSTYEDCIVRRSGGDGFIIHSEDKSHDNTFRRCWADSCGTNTTYYDGDGFTAHGGSYNNNFEYCMGTYCTCTGVAFVGTSSGKIYNCTFWGNGINEAVQNRGNIYINCTAANDSSGVSWEMKNCIVGMGFPGETTVNNYVKDLVVFDNNLYYPKTPSRTATVTMDGGTNWAGWTWLTFPQYVATGHDTNSLNADPKFENLALNDWRIKKTSPAIKKGTQVLPIGTPDMWGKLSKAWANIGASNTPSVAKEVRGFKGSTGWKQ